MSRRSKREAELVERAAREAAKELVTTQQKLSPQEAQRIVDEAAMERERKRRGRVIYRLRRHIYPWKAAGVLLAIAAVCWIVGWFSGAAIGAVLPVAVIGVLVKAWLWSKKAGQWATRVKVGGGVASVWLITAALTGRSWAILLLLVTATAAVSAGYWRATALGDDDEDRPVRIESIPMLWRNHIANDNGALPESQLFAPEFSDDGLVDYTVQLRRGRETFQTALQNMAKISSGLDVPMRNLVIEPHPNESPSQMRLTIVTRSPIAKTVVYTGPQVSGGVVLPGAFEDPEVELPEAAVVRLGPYADNRGAAGWRFWTPGEVLNGGSAWGGFIGGGMGSGKSRTLEEICIGAMSTGWMETWFLDPQGGASSPSLRDAADWYGDLSDAGTLLDALEGFIDIRGKEMAHEGWIGYDPSPERPMLNVVIDECHEVFGIKADLERWITVARKIRKVGGGLTGLSQYFGLPTFGNREELRSSIFAGNIIVMRSESKHSGQLVPGLSLDPMTLPALPGFGYTVARGGSNARTAPFRAEYVKEPSAWFRMFPGPGLDQLATEGCGDIYKNRHDLAEEKRASLGESIALIRAGHAMRKQDRPTRPAASAESAGDPWFKPGAWVAPVMQLVRNLAEESSDNAAQTARDKILARLSEGVAQKAELMKAANVSEVRTRQVLNSLIEQGAVEKAEHGWYRMAPANRSSR